MGDTHTHPGHHLQHLCYCAQCTRVVYVLCLWSVLSLSCHCSPLLRLGTGAKGITTKPRSRFSLSLARSLFFLPWLKLLFLALPTPGSFKVTPSPLLTTPQGGSTLVPMPLLRKHICTVLTLLGALEWEKPCSCSFQDQQPLSALPLAASSFQKLLESSLPPPTP